MKAAPSRDFVLQCSNCGEENPVALEDLDKRNRCGRCSTILIKSNCLPKDVTDGSWEAEVADSAVPVVAYFWGPNCPVCANYDLSVRRMAASFCGTAKVVAMNAEENPVTPKRYDLKGVPTVMIFSGGKLVAGLPGPRGEQGLREILDRITG